MRTSNKKHGTIGEMFLERRIIAVLNQTYIDSGRHLSWNELVEYLVDNRCKIFTCWSNREKFKRKIKRVIGDCIHGDATHFGGGAPIGYLIENPTHRGDVPLSVTEYGRRFIQWPRFMSLMMMEHKGLGILLGGVLGGVATIGWHSIYDGLQFIKNLLPQ